MGLHKKKFCFILIINNNSNEHNKEHKYDKIVCGDMSEIDSKRWFEILKNVIVWMYIYIYIIFITFTFNILYIPKYILSIYNHIYIFYTFRKKNLKLKY